MQNLENLDVFDFLITQKELKCPKDPFVRSALNYTCENPSFFGISNSTFDDLEHELDFHFLF